MNGPDRQAYDRGTTVFSPDGRLYQVEYAREAVGRGAPTVGVAGGESVVLAAHVDERSPLIERQTPAKLFPVEGRIGVASAGHAADARQLVDLARRTAAAERRRYGEPVDAATLSRAVADRIQEHTQQGGTRPFGAALLIAGATGRPSLFEVDPSGATDAWSADAVGRGGGEALERLEAAYEPSLATDDALSTALDGLDVAVEEFDPDAVEAAVVDDDGYEPLADDRIRAAS
jgi:proteasome alpha subunit